MSDKSTETDSASIEEVCPPDAGPPESNEPIPEVPLPLDLFGEPDAAAADSDDRILEENLFLTLRPSVSSTVVNQVRRTVYDRSSESLYAIMDTRLASIEWVLLFARHNNTSQTETHQTRFTTRLTVTNGTTASRELGVSAAFRGLGISFGASSTTFSQHETTEEREQTTTYQVPPRSSLYVYQREYRFIQRIWWILDAWNEHWTIGANGTYATVVADIGVSISADERISSDRPLVGSRSVTVRSAPRPDSESRQRRRQFMNATSRARQSIERTIASANTPVNRKPDGEPEAPKEESV